jgi:hypothetical protein
VHGRGGTGGTDVGSGDDGVEGSVGLGRVAAAANDGNLELGHVRHDGARDHRHHAHRLRRPVVVAVHLYPHRHGRLSARADHWATRTRVHVPRRRR